LDHIVQKPFPAQVRLERKLGTTVGTVHRAVFARLLEQRGQTLDFVTAS